MYKTSYNSEWRLKIEINQYLLHIDRFTLLDEKFMADGR